MLTRIVARNPCNAGRQFPGSEASQRLTPVTTHAHVSAIITDAGTSACMMLRLAEPEQTPPHNLAGAMLPEGASWEGRGCSRGDDELQNGEQSLRSTTCLGKRTTLPDAQPIISPLATYPLPNESVEQSGLATVGPLADAHHPMHQPQQHSPSSLPGQLGTCSTKEHGASAAVDLT
jgi:hypothetical protein